MPDGLDHATGLERKELEAIAKGNPVRVHSFSYNNEAGWWSVETNYINGKA